MQAPGSIDCLQALIRENIPLSAAMQFRIDKLESYSISVSAPLHPNINIHGTAFAGSLYALSVLSAWGLTSHIVKSAGVDADVVVANAEIKYRVPVYSGIVCNCQCDPEKARDMLEAVRVNHKAALELDVEIGNEPQAQLHARMVVILATGA